MQITIRKLSHLLSYYLLPLVLLGVTLVSLSSSDFLYAFFSTLGYPALGLLLIILFVKPIAMITKYRPLLRIITYRRELGVATFWFFLFHGVGLLVITSYPADILFSPGSFLFWGLVAAVPMTLLGLTSNTFAVQKLGGKNWKRLHRLAYVALIAALIHYGLQESLIVSIILIVVFIILKLIEWNLRTIKSKISDWQVRQEN